MENKAYNEYIAQLDKISDLIKKTTKISDNSKIFESYKGSRNFEGKPHGQGTLTDSDGTRFTGNWIDGVLTGKGIIDYENGDKYEGDIVNLEQHGNGKYTFKNGDIYDGQWKNGKRNGQGIYTWENGSTYKGEWKNDNRNGSGIEKEQDGSVIIEGIWKDDVCVTITTSDSAEIEIEGTFGKALYNGKIINGKPEGFGKADYDNGQYEGEWKNGKKDGIGKFTWKIGNLGHVYNGKWVNDIRDGIGKQIYSNGDIYEGEWYDLRSGKGKMTYKDGTIYDGEWKDGKPIISDIDGNVYGIVKIGRQMWLAENLKTSRYRNGDPIPNITNEEKWENLVTGACCNYGNDTKNGEIYGRLYNWYAINDYRTIAPIGWHVPTNDEWETLINYLGGNEVAGGKLKEAGTLHWEEPNESATNESGFSALPGSERNKYGIFNYLRLGGEWWSSTEYDDDDEAWAYYTHIVNRSSYMSMYGDGNKASGFSVRCVRDFY